MAQRVLIVEDDAITRELLASVLGNRGFRCDQAGDGHGRHGVDPRDAGELDQEQPARDAERGVDVGEEVRGVGLERGRVRPSRRRVEHGARDDQDVLHRAKRLSQPRQPHAGADGGRAEGRHPRAAVVPAQRI